jgi:hypothetical protein
MYYSIGSAESIPNYGLGTSLKWAFEAYIGLMVPSTQAKPCDQPLLPRFDCIMYEEALECFFMASVMIKVRIKPESDMKSASDVIFGTSFGIKY